IMKKQNEQRLEPKLRFKGFTDDWEQRELGSLVDFYSGLTYKPKNVTDEKGVFVIRSSNINHGEIIKGDNIFVKSDTVNSENVCKGDIVVVVRNSSRNLIGKHAQVLEVMENTVIGAFMTGVRYEYPNFLNALLDSYRFKREIHRNLGATINQITTNNFKSMKFYFPNNDEQIKIGKIFENINALITLHKRKGILLKFLRDFYLYLFFQQNFFNNNTESIKLKDITEITTGNLNANDAVKNGLYNFYTCSKAVLKTDRYAFEGNALTVAGNGDVGHIKQVSGRFNAYQRTYVIQNLKADFDYLYYELYTKLPKQIHRETAKGVMPYIVMGTLSELLVDLPSKDKQEKISSYLNMINKLINEQEMKVDRLKSLKQLYLEKLFI